MLATAPAPHRATCHHVGRFVSSAVFVNGDELDSLITQWEAEGVEAITLTFDDLEGAFMTWVKKEVNESTAEKDMSDG